MCSSKTRARRKKKKTSLITLLPEDILMDCIARVPKPDYPSLSQVCKLFKSMVASSELYARRSLLGCTEYCIYLTAKNTQNSNMCWFTINNNRLVPIYIRSLYPSRRGKRYVVVGSKIFVLGGYNRRKFSSAVLSIDCRYDIAKPIGTMPYLVAQPVYDVADGKIYVIGGRYWKKNNNRFSDVWSSDKMMVLDTEAKTWECKSSGLEAGRMLTGSVSMEDRIYINGVKDNIFVFEPKESKWEDEKVDADELVQYYNRMWENGCVIDGILYIFDCKDYCLRAYDLKLRLFCGVVHGLEGLINQQHLIYNVHVARCGSKTMMLLWNKILGRSSGIWGAEIALKEKNEKGEIWGNVEWCQLLLAGYTFTNCLTVVV